MNENDEHSPISTLKRDPTRLIALTDGVFAIIMTILVLELHVPVAANNGELKSNLIGLCYKLFLYFISFLLAGVYWVGHRSLFNLVAHVNNRLIWINIVFLMIASLIPFGANLLGQYPHMPLALQAYGILLFLLAAWRLFMYLYVTGNPKLLNQKIPPDVRKRVIGVMVSAPVLFLISIFAAPHFPNLAIILYAFTPPMFVTLITLVNKYK